MEIPPKNEISSEMLQKSYIVQQNPENAQKRPVGSILWPKHNPPSPWTPISRCLNNELGFTIRGVNLLLLKIGWGVALNKTLANKNLENRALAF